MFALRRLVFASFYLLLLFIAFAHQALAFQPAETRAHVTFNIGSYHHNAMQDFNEFNPGVGVGLTFAFGRPNVEIDVEAGQYRNSLNDNSVYVMSSIDTQIARLSPSVTLRAGAFMGLSHYPGDNGKFKGRGVPTFGNWVMGAGAQTSLRIKNDTDIRVRIMPAGDVADVLFTLQMVQYF